MKISDLIKMGLKNLSRRKARTALTVIGVVIGTLSIIVMISVGIGMNENFTKEVMEYGSLTTITVNQYADIRDENGNYVNSYKQKMDDKLVQSIRQLEHVKAVSPTYQASASLQSRGCIGWAQLTAIDFSTLEDFDFPKLSYGEYPETPDDTVIFGAQVLSNFWNARGNGNQPPVTIDPEKDKIVLQVQPNIDVTYEMTDSKKEAPLKKIAVMEPSGSEDYTCYMDMEAFKQYYTEFVKKSVKKSDRSKALRALKEYNGIQVNVDNVNNVKKVQDQIENDLGFQTYSLSKMFEPMQKSSQMMQLVLGFVGAISMIVSAISIANTMVMSIYERTKEIGVMKVLGCLVTDVKKLFLFEAGMIGLLGGGVGIGLSYLASFLINKFGAPIFASLNSMGGFGDMTQQMDGARYSIIPIWLPFAAALFAMIVGLLSGYYPAKRATKISAIEAMKSEG